jgi:tetrapyrrole methylase family protein / MazG family protein
MADGGTLTIVGLGPGSAGDITRRAWDALASARQVILRTREHPCVPELPGVEHYQFCDDVYESTGDFSLIYRTIVARVLDAVGQGDVVYAVPGDPLVGESTVKQLVAACAERGIACTLLPGVSFIEPTLHALKLDAVDGLQIYDALELAMAHHPPVNPDYPALLAQVYSRQAASDLKLTLMNQYPDDFDVALVHAAGTGAAQVEWVKLYEIDRSEHLEHLSSLYLPALGGMSSFERFQETIAHLRAPEGCPWDRKQTHLSLRKYLLEEAYEVLDALDREDMPALAEELGDLLLQIVLHAQIAIDDGEFRMTDILRTVNAKMIRRHPHVWGDVSVSGADQVVTNWDAIKQREKADKGDAPAASLLDGVPKALPALMQAYDYTAKAAKPGFDWPRIEDVIAKVREEIDEVLAAADDAHRAEEMGDLLFVIVNWARWHRIDPEQALRAANAKFARRFAHVEARARASGRPLDAHTLAEMDAYWDDAKRLGL